MGIDTNTDVDEWVEDQLDDSESGPETVEIRGNSLSVTPVQDLPLPQNMAACAKLGQVGRELEDGESVASYQGLYEVCGMCTDESISPDTIRDLSINELSEILEVVFRGADVDFDG